MPNTYRKHFLPLESNPDVFNELIHLLGASNELVFEDVFSLDDDDFLPRPTLALILVFPTTPAYGARKAAAESVRPEYTGGSNEEAAVWFKQTINNACGMYAILHALSNGTCRQFLETDSIFSRLLERCIPLRPGERAQALEGSAELEKVYDAVASKGDSAVPENAEDEVDFHYICFVRSDADGRLYELDGDTKGPVALGPLELGERGDILCPASISHIKTYIDQGEDTIGFSLLALVDRSEQQPNSKSFDTEQE